MEIVDQHKEIMKLKSLEAFPKISMQYLRHFSALSLLVSALILEKILSSLLWEKRLKHGSAVSLTGSSCVGHHLIL